MNFSIRETRLLKKAILTAILIVMAVGATYLYSTSEAIPNSVDAISYQSVIISRLEVDDLNQTLVTRALESAQERGLQLSEDPTQNRSMIEMIIQTTRAGWDTVIRADVSPEAIVAGYNLEQPVLVFVMRGQVDWSKGPGLPNPEEISPAIFDNLYLVTDAETGRRISSGAFNPGQQLPFYPEGTFAGGTEAVYRNSSDILPLPPNP